jgi:thiosulfate reductase/polysulfide reductase chain A
MRTGITWTMGLSAGHHLMSGQKNQKMGAVSRTSLKSLASIPTTCKQCAAGCGVLAYLNGNELVQVLGNPEHPINHGGICARGIAGINLANDPERLLFPMKRIGPRNDGPWARITWDEAYTVLSRRIKESNQENRANECVWDIGESDPLLSRFIDTIGSHNRIDRNLLKNRNRDLALRSMITDSLLLEDVGQTRTILNFGANPYANHERFLPMARQLVDARIYKGAKLVTFDVRMSETAAQSDEWIPIRPGTDALVALAMARVILVKNLADNTFIRSKTNVSIDQLSRHLASYSPEVAERESGVKATVIERLAVAFASKKPSVAIFGGGICDHENGTQNVRCISLLNWITGNLGKEGGLLVPSAPGPLWNNTWNEQNFSRKTEDKGVTFSDLFEKQLKVNTYIAYMANPVYSEPDNAAATRFLEDQKNVPFLVVIDTHFTETARIADLVLPAASYLEGWGVELIPLIDGSHVLNLRQPVISLLSSAQTLRLPDFEPGKLLEPAFRPRGEAKEIGNVCLELARRLEEDIQHHLPFKDTKDFITQVVASIPDCDFNTLKTKGYWTGKPSEVDSRMQQMNESKGTLNSVSIYSQSLEDKFGASLPSYAPIKSLKGLKPYEFVLTTYKSNLWARGAANSKWAREIFHENCLWINHHAAEKLGIVNGERVRVVSSLGALEVRVLTTGRIHPQSVALAEGLGHDAIGNIAKAKRFKSSDLDTTLLWWTKAGHGVNPFKIIENDRDPVGGGYALKDTVIHIEKI